jgi:hypothetical protein
MTVDTIGTNSPRVFDAGLLPIAYEHAQTPMRRTGSFGRPACRGRSRWGRTGLRC